MRAEYSFSVGKRVTTTTDSIDGSLRGNRVITGRACIDTG